MMDTQRIIPSPLNVVDSICYFPPEHFSALFPSPSTFSMMIVQCSPS